MCQSYFNKVGLSFKKSSATFWFTISLTGCFFSWNFRFYFSPKRMMVIIQTWIFDIMDWILCHQKCIWWNPIPPYDVIKRRTLWEVIGVKWGHEGGALLKGVSALLRTKRELAASFCLPPTSTLKLISLHPGRELSPEFIHAVNLVSDFQPPALWRITFCCLWALSLW